MPQWIDKFRRTSNVFKMTKVEINSQCMNYFEVEVYKGERRKHTGTLDYKPYFKPSGLGIPLSPSSAHIENVHKIWPIGYIRRLSANSSTHDDFKSAKATLMNKIHTMYPNSYHLAMWLHFDPYMAKMC